MSDESHEPTQEEIDAALQPGSDFWKWDRARQDRVLEELRQRSEHPAILEMQRELLALLRRAAREQPEVMTLVAAAREAVEVLHREHLHDVAGPLERAITALEASVP